ncbi:unnamed protein product [Fusarium venenatum]|uniref:Uncharacterized protein n=1 Tax=Fusarium venenatum TaxID=56646 RepID=A0A2L2TSI2_9HYPO|nr:uncharacterized protein FVRRES_00572 [Fusarium venenatum]CEI64060.1 unnamed protein product [Fusarium venenatum]
MLPLVQIVRGIRCIPQRSIAKLQTYHEAGIRVLGSQFESGVESLLPTKLRQRRVPTGAFSFRASWSALPHAMPRLGCWFHMEGSFSAESSKSLTTRPRSSKTPSTMLRFLKPKNKGYILGVLEFR